MTMMLAIPAADKQAAAASRRTFAVTSKPKADRDAIIRRLAKRFDAAVARVESAGDALDAPGIVNRHDQAAVYATHPASIAAWSTHDAAWDAAESAGEELAKTIGRRRRAATVAGVTYAVGADAEDLTDYVAGDGKVFFWSRVRRIEH